LYYNKPARRLSSLCLRGACLVLLLGLTAAFYPLQGQSFSSLDRERVQGMLSVIKGDIKKNYYDPNFHGIDLDVRFKAAEEKIKSIDSLGQAYGVIAQVLSEFNDSHLFFLPPPRPANPEYGWRMQMIGNDCVVFAVKPGSDAEAKGLKPGDRILKVDGFAPTRDNLWKMEYRYNILRPQAGIQVVAQTGNEEPRPLDLKAKVIQGKRKLDFTGNSGVEDIEAVLREIDEAGNLTRHRYVDNLEVFIWKMPQFDLEKDKVDDMMNKAAKHKALILDLRGNGGGAEETLQRLIGNLFDHEIKIADIKRRKDTKPLVAKSRGKDIFTGQLIVLVDSRSASAAEVLARVVQLEKRGTVIGDQTKGAVMRSQGYHYEMGANSILFYGASITDADAIMGDGKSLEHIGVTPDELLLPSGPDLAANRDPVLSRAAELAGVKLDPEKAGALFPVEWKK
jgi:C-terminal processing protease CtpA/Prc